MAQSPVTPQGVDVPTQEEFDALAARVTDLEGRVSALEGGGQPVPPDPSPDPDTLTVASPAEGSTLSGVVEVTGLAGATWVNITAWVGDQKGADDAQPVDGRYSLQLDSSKLANGPVTLIVRGYDVPPGGVGTSKDVPMTYTVANADGPPGPDPSPGTGTQAKRIHSLVELFGVNTFSSLDSGNVWGSYPADYQPDSVIAGLNWITDESGFAFRIREYHYNGREQIQQPWLTQVVAALPGTEVSICVGANGSPADVSSMLTLANDPACAIRWLEGLNEPNTNFGSGEVSVDVTKAIQDELWGSADRAGVLGPSIVAGTPHPEGWITGYCGEYMGAINAAMARCNGHYYPPASPDVPNTGYSVSEYISGIRLAYDNHPGDLTEFHPTLYNSQGHKPDQSGWDGERDAYYTLTTLFRCGKLDPQVGLWWYALFDYGTVYLCGLYPMHGGEDPRPAAAALRNLCEVCADPGNSTRTFAPGKLEISVEGLPADADWDLYQASDGRFIVPLWRSAQELGGDATDVTLRFGAAVQLVEEFDLIHSADAVGSMDQTQEYVVHLSASARAIVVHV